jgi:hypothetical protein
MVISDTSRANEDFKYDTNNTCNGAPEKFDQSLFCNATFSSHPARRAGGYLPGAFARSFCQR